jgi:hypothetical protein
MTTRFRFFVSVAIVALLSGCGDDAPATDASASGRQLLLEDLPTPDIGLRTAASRILKVRYLTLAGAPIVGEPISFTISGTPRGSTLSDATVYSDSNGIAAVEVRAGAAETAFLVDIDAPSAPQLRVYVQVSNAGFGSLSINAEYSGTSMRSITRVEYRLYSGLQCATLTLPSPGPALRERSTSSAAEVATFSALALDQDLSVLALAYGDQRRLRASACAEIPAQLTSKALVLTMQLRLEDLQPILSLQYTLQSEIRLPATSRPLASALRPWGALTDCELGPARWVLDCVLDARDDGDPLDCIVENPSPETRAIMQNRGVLSAGCRAALTSDGRPSVESVLMANLQASASSKLEALRTIEARAKNVLSSLTLQSTLALSATDELWRAYATHTLQRVTFQNASDSTTLDLNAIAVPSRSAGPILATATGWRLTLATHQLGLRFGLLARVAFGELVLQRDWPKQTEAVVGALVDGMASPKSGCSGLDERICVQARLLPGCLKDACEQGARVLTSKLDQGFSAMDSFLPQLTLAGEAKLDDSAGDLKVDTIGLGTNAEALGAWTTAEITLAGEKASLQASFSGRSQ